MRFLSFRYIIRLIDVSEGTIFNIYLLLVIKNDRKKLDMDSADPQNRSEWRGRLRGRLVKKAQPSVEENGL